MKSGALNKRQGTMTMLLGGMLILAGCNGPEAKLEGQVEALRRSILATHKSAKDYELVGRIRYDIRKTDSLISPLEGQIDYTVSWESEKERFFSERRLIFAYQHRDWVLMGVQRRAVPTLYGEGWEDAGMIPGEWQLYSGKSSP
jgi:hypothetical protein